MTYRTGEPVFNAAVVSVKIESRRAQGSGMIDAALVLRQEVGQWRVCGAGIADMEVLEGAATSEAVAVKTAALSFLKGTQSPDKKAAERYLTERARQFQKGRLDALGLGEANTTYTYTLGTPTLNLAVVPFYAVKKGEDEMPVLLLLMREVSQWKILSFLIMGESMEEPARDTAKPKASLARSTMSPEESMVTAAPPADPNKAPMPDKTPAAAVAGHAATATARSPVASSVQAGVMPDPGNLAAYAQKIGATFQFQVTGSAAGTVWGTDLYTLDSPLAAAAVHAGILKNGERGVVKVTVLAGKQSYRGSSKNGVTSSDWGPYEGSYKVEKSDGKVRVPAGPPVAPDNMSAFADKIGQQMVFEVTGATVGTVWGTDVYTLDSQVSAAAVHAGAIAVGKTGKIKVALLPGKAAYKGSTRNGVTSSDWGSYQGSYRVEKVQ
jgi:hypothetical protein